MKHKSNRQSSRAVGKREGGEQQRQRQTNIKCQSNAYLAMRARQTNRQPATNREQTASKPSRSRWRERGRFRGGGEAAKWRRLLPVPSTSKASQRCTVNLRSRFITGTMRHGYGNSSLFHAADQPLLPPIPLPSLNWELPHALALNASLTTCP